MQQSEEKKHTKKKRKQSKESIDKQEKEEMDTHIYTCKRWHQDSEMHCRIESDLCFSVCMSVCLKIEVWEYALMEEGKGRRSSEAHTYIPPADTPAQREKVVKGLEFDSSANSHMHTYT